MWFVVAIAALSRGMNGHIVIDTHTSGCKTPPTTRLCGDRSLRSRAYHVPSRWPFDSFHLVMEMTNGTCDMYRLPGNESFCCRITREFHEPERGVSEAIASFLSGCSRRPKSRPCRAIDVGANNGWFSAYMLQLGAHVVSIEPQPDLARAVQDTVNLNCWGERSTVVNARLCASRDMGCMMPTKATNCDIKGWRFGGGPSQLTNTHGHACASVHGLPTSVGGQNLRKILLHSQASSARQGGVTELDLLKIDVDGPEGRLLLEIDDLITQGLLRIRTLIVEASFVRPSQMLRLQRTHGYTLYRLDAHDARRHMTRTGWDALSAPGTIAPLGRYSHAADEAFESRFSPHTRRGFSSGWRPALRKGVQDDFKPFADGVSRVQLEEELFGTRAMRHVFRAKPDLSLQAWTTLMNPVHHFKFESAPTQWVMTLDGDVTEPTLAGADYRSVSAEYAHAKKAHYLPAEFEANYRSLARAR